MRPEDDANQEAWVLTTDAGLALLSEVVAVPVPGPADLMRWRAREEARHVAAAIRIVDTRRRAARKFTRFDRMWFERTGLEQATAELVARHKARRFTDRALTVFDLCCGVGGDTLALAVGADVVAVDSDQGMCRRTRWNAAVYGVAERVAVIRSRTETVALPSGAWVHIDPDRRVRSLARAKRLEAYTPGLDYLLPLARSASGGAIKVGPASDFDDHFSDERFEVELVSLGGECKEATVWFGEAAGCRRRATRLPEGATWTDRDGPRGAYAAVGPVEARVFDPDPSLARAGLLDAFAVSHGIRRIAAGVDYLTGPEIVATPFLAAFEVDAVLPLDFKKLRREIVARRVGTLEVKTRGIALSPEGVRAKLKPSGDQPATLLIAGGSGRSIAVLARRVSCSS
jgi:SAM-dependent methyltransferase